MHMYKKGRKKEFSIGKNLYLGGRYLITVEVGVRRRDAPQHKGYSQRKGKEGP